MSCLPHSDSLTPHAAQPRSAAPRLSCPARLPGIYDSTNHPRIVRTPGARTRCPARKKLPYVPAQLAAAAAADLPTKPVLPLLFNYYIINNK